MWQSKKQQREAFAVKIAIQAVKRDLYKEAMQPMAPNPKSLPENYNQRKYSGADSFAEIEFTLED